MAQVVGTDGLDELVQSLRVSGWTVVGPVVRDGVIVHDEISAASELPIGWTEEQDGGTYRLARTGTDERFAFSSPSSSWKAFLNPPRTLIIRSRRHEGTVEIDEPEPEAPAFAFFGIRSCDLASLDVLDRVFLDPTATDPTYAARRSDVFTVAVACGHPASTCFCASMETGPSPRAGYDLALTELHGPDSHEFLATAGTERGEVLLQQITTRDRERRRPRPLPTAVVERSSICHGQP